MPDFKLQINKKEIWSGQETYLVTDATKENAAHKLLDRVRLCDEQGTTATDVPDITLLTTSSTFPGIVNPVLTIETGESYYSVCEVDEHGVLLDDDPIIDEEDDEDDVITIEPFSLEDKL